MSLAEVRAYPRDPRLNDNELGAGNEGIFNQWLRAASGLTAPLVVSGGPDFMKLPDIDHAGDGEVLICQFG